MKQGLAETLLCWAFSSLPFCRVPFLTASLLSSQSPCWFIFNIYLSTFFFCPYLSPRRICFEIILKFWVKVHNLVTLGSRAMEEKQVGCLFVQHRLHLCAQPQHFVQCFCFAHSCCLLKISICITGIFLFNLFSFWAQRAASAAKKNGLVSLQEMGSLGYYLLQWKKAQT